MHRLTVSELRDHWDAFSKRGPEQSIEVVPPFQMPPWETICAALRWSVYSAGGGYFLKKNLDVYGVYRLVALEGEGTLSTPAMLDRICGKDATGTLYIGKTNSLSRRLNELRRSLRRKSVGGYESSHGAAAALRRLPGLNLPPSRLAIALLPTHRWPRAIEDDLIGAYMNTFGDAPPLNYRVGK